MSDETFIRVKAIAADGSPDMITLWVIVRRGDWAVTRQDWWARGKDGPFVPHALTHIPSGAAAVFGEPRALEALAEELDGLVPVGTGTEEARGRVVPLLMDRSREVLAYRTVLWGQGPHRCRWVGKVPAGWKIARKAG